MASEGDPGSTPGDWLPWNVASPTALLVALAVVSAVALVVAASTSGAAFGVANPGWDGASNLRAQAEEAGAEPTVVRNTSQYAEVPAEGSLALVLSPDRRYGEADAARLRRFVRDGGTLVVAEDFGAHGNPLLASVGADARVNGTLVRDERHTYRSPAMPVATNVSNHSLAANVSRLTLNHGTVVEPNGARVVVATSEFAYLDTTRNDRLDDTESLGSYPVVTVESVGQGRVITVSDPSLFINAMLERPGNDRFTRTAFGAHERVLLDYSHAERLPPLAVASLVVRESPPLQVAVLGGLVGLLAAWSRGWFAPLGRVVRDGEADEPTVDEGRVLAHLRASHPGWDRDRLDRVAKGVRPQRGNSERDD